jgi:hypothetical protein
VDFFSPIEVSTPEFERQPRSALPWDESFGKTVVTDVMLGRSSDGAVLLRNVVAYPLVVTFGVVAHLRRPLVSGRGPRGFNFPRFSASIGEESVPTGVVLFGVRFADGSSYRNLDGPGTEGHLESLGGGGGTYVAEHRFMVDLPPEGDLEFWVAWPAADLPETCTTLDASAIRIAAATVGPIWT